MKLRIVAAAALALSAATIAHAGKLGWDIDYPLAFEANLHGYGWAARVEPSCDMYVLPDLFAEKIRRDRLYNNPANPELYAAYLAGEKEFREKFALNGAGACALGFMVKDAVFGSHR